MLLVSSFSPLSRRASRTLTRPSNPLRWVGALGTVALKNITTEGTEIHGGNTKSLSSSVKSSRQVTFPCKQTLFSRRAAIFVFGIKLCAALAAGFSSSLSLFVWFVSFVVNLHLHIPNQRRMRRRESGEKLDT
jgi:hypothetical protein